MDIEFDSSSIITCITAISFLEKGWQAALAAKRNWIVQKYPFSQKERINSKVEGLVLNFD